MPSTMRNLVITLSILLAAAVPLAAQYQPEQHHHDGNGEPAPLTHDQLLERFQELTGHPMKAAVPMPDMVPIEGDSARAFTITASSFQFNINPMSFVVNQGDVVTLTITVPSNDQSSIGHGVLMEQYIPNGVNVGRGKTQMVTFTASMAGTFNFICTQPSCGTGHNSMVGIFTVNAGPPGPAITSIQPTSTSTAGGATITVNGSNFNSGLTAKVDGTAVTTSFVSGSQFTFVAPAHAAGQATITVTNPDSQQATTSLTYVAPQPPTITSLSPSTVSTAGGVAVTISGSNFVSGATVKVDGASASVTSVSSSQIVFTAPAHSAGSATITVTNPDGQSANGTLTYMFVGPTMSSVAPASGPNSGNTNLTISGSGFQPGATVTIGAFNAVNVRLLDSGTIVATTIFGPANEPLGVAQDVVVHNPDGTSASKSGAFTFTLASLSISNISPNRALAGAAVTITGTGFSSGITPVVTFGGVPATNVTVIDSVTLRATAPVHANGLVDVVVTAGSSTVTASGGFTYAPTPLHRRAVGH
jgi:heme/copper-type cytochrome/quinol oxidase subunit 2